MGVQNPNSTSYVHPNEPNLLNIHKAMVYDPVNGEPHLRVFLGSDTITINGEVNLVDDVRVNNSTTNPVPVFLTNVPTTSTVFQGTSPWDTTITNWPALQYVNGVLYAVQSGTWNVNVTSLPAVSGTVAVSNFPTSVTVTNFTSTVFVSNTLTISNTSFAVTNFPTTSTVYQGTNPWTITGTVAISSLPEVEIKNDTGNPIPISKNTTPNAASNPIFVSADLVGSGERSGSLSNIDSKGRLKVQTQETIFFNTFQYGKETDVWDESAVTGASATHDPAYSQVRMDVSGTIGSKVIRQTRNTQRYTPGRQQSIAFAMRFQAPTVGIRRRIGMFNSITDGFYFEDCGTRDAGTNLPQYACVVVNSGMSTTERVYRADWNGDKLDGTGVSGITIDFSKQQLFMFDYEWYGAGNITFSVVINGLPRVFHTIYNGNRLSSPWAVTPFLPIRVEIENLTGVAGTHSVWQGSNSLLTEGTVEKLGIAESILTPLTGINMSSANTFYPIISIRLKSTALQGIVLPSYFQAGTVDNTDIYYKLLRNATVNGTWVDHPDPNAFTQYNYTSTGAITDGSELTSGLLTAGGAAGAIPLDQATVYQIGRGSLGTVSDTITLAIAAKNANKNAVANMTWIEQR